MLSFILLECDSFECLLLSLLPLEIQLSRGDHINRHIFVTVPICRGLLFDIRWEVIIRFVDISVFVVYIFFFLID
jgi:hypothetical protein